MTAHTITHKDIHALTGYNYPETKNPFEAAQRLIHRLAARYAAWSAYRKAVADLSEFSDAELRDMGIRRC
ncbi:MAG: DUF1127 domain-containing protein, partial [Pseudomonadota bacterium]